MRSFLAFMLAVASLVATSHAFMNHPGSSISSRVTKLSMATSPKTGSIKRKPPTFDKTTQRWIPASTEDSAAGAYDALGSLLRQGPKAYFTRITNPDQYDQACLKFMAQEGCSYQMAQGNLDRMNENMQDWIMERMEAEKKGRKIDYVTLDQQQVALTVVWGTAITALLARGVYVAITGDSYNDIFR